MTRKTGVAYKSMKYELCNLKAECTNLAKEYKEVWEAAVGESLVCEREPENASDRYPVAVKEELT